MREAVGSAQTAYGQTRQFNRTIIMNDRPHLTAPFHVPGMRTTKPIQCGGSKRTRPRENFPWTRDKGSTLLIPGETVELEDLMGLMGPTGPASHRLNP
jgi:hypothetical protein